MATAAELILSHLGDAEVIADLYRSRLLDRGERLSAAYLGLVRAAGAWKEGGGAAFRTYAGTAMLRAIGQDIRALRRRPTVRMPDEHDRPDREPGPAAVAERREELAWLRDALDRLPPRQRLILLRHADGATHDAIAEALGLSRRAARWAHESGIARLRAALGDPAG